MIVLSVEIEIASQAATVSRRTSRQELQSLFGPPDDVGGFSRKKKRGGILKYGQTEFHFDGDQDEDCLFLIYREQDVDGVIVPEVSIRL
jgi:hypothetical protein